MRGGIVTLLTDFGTADGYVGELKGALLSGAPDARLVDIAHDIPPQDVWAARFAVSRYWRAFPSGTVHLIVVDPGVGSARRALAVKSGDWFFVGPDNGVLTPVLVEGSHSVELSVPDNASRTFHGRDVFAPAAAKLARGATMESLGRPAPDPARLDLPKPAREGNDWRGEIIAIDRFGNAITNIEATGARVIVTGRELRVVGTYSDLAPGESGALRGSSGLLEIVVRDGSAAVALGLERGTPVHMATN